MIDIRIGNVADGSILGDYYLDFSRTIDEVTEGLYGPFDPEGVPLVDYDRLFLGSPNVRKNHCYGIHYTPVTIAQYGLGLYSSHLRLPNDESARLFLRMADWHVNNLTRMPLGFSVWVHGFEFPVFNLNPPWVSGMAQGQGLSLLLRAYQFTGNGTYLDSAHDAFKAFQFDIRDGGASVAEGDDDFWLEEYPNKPPSHVLNGFIFALWGVYDYYRVTNSHVAGVLIDRCVDTLSRNIHRYEGYSWSLYDLLRSPVCSVDYHRLHVLQLEVMARLTSDSVLLEHAQRWRSYLDGKGHLKRLAYRYARGLLRRTGIRYQSETPFTGITAPCVK